MRQKHWYKQYLAKINEDKVKSEKTLQELLKEDSKEEINDDCQALIEFTNKSAQILSERKVGQNSHQFKNKNQYQQFMSRLKEINARDDEDS